MLFNKTTLFPGFLIAGLLIAGFLSSAVLAAETSETRRSKSISFSSSAELDLVAKDTLLQQADTDIMAPLNEQGFRVESTVMALHIVTNDVNHHADITLYDASTELISDFNYDGFYHRFSITIDLDTIYDTAYVYTKLYLSYEGGPWQHYATSENYLIHGDSELDSFIIETELADGYPPGYYDVRIEVYDADYNAWLLSYGPYDDSSLSVLPLEDSYYDNNSAYYPVETEIVVAGHGHGSMGWLLLIIPALLVMSRRLTAISTLYAR